MKLCYDCANIIDSDSDICPCCGADTDDGRFPKENSHLTPGTGLKNDRYIVGRAVNSYKYGIVYAAFDTFMNERVAITEYFPKGIAARVPGKPKVLVHRGTGNDEEYINGFKSFVERSEKLAAQGAEGDDDDVLECFYENNTAYTVTEPLRLPEKKKSSRGWVYGLLGGIIALCAILAALILTGVIKFPDGSEATPEETEEVEETEALIAVPDLVGMTEGEARLTYPDWDMVLMGTVQSDEYPAGVIMRQDPDAGSYAPTGSAIGITISLGDALQAGTMPYVRGMNVEEARELLEGYSIVETYEYDSALFKNCVVSSSPEFGETLGEGQKIELTISLGGLLEGIRLDPSDAELDLDSGERTLTLTYSLIPANVDPSSVTLEWLITGDSGASVSDGTVTFTSPGRVTVTALASMTNEKTGDGIAVTGSARLTASGASAAQTPKPAKTQAATSKPTSTPKPVTPTPRPTTPKPATPTPKPTTPRPATPTPRPTLAPTPTPVPMTPVPFPTATPTQAPTPRPTPMPTQPPALPTIPLLPTPTPTETDKPTDG